MANRICSHFRNCGAEKRKAFLRDPSDAIDDELMSRFSNQEAQTELADLIEFLLGKLDQQDPSGELRRIALLYLDEYSASSIAKMPQRRKTNVLHKIQWIRAIWEEALLHE